MKTILGFLVVVLACSCSLAARAVDFEISKGRTRPSGNPLVEQRRLKTITTLPTDPPLILKMNAMQSMGTRSECAGDFLITDPPVCVIRWTQDIQSDNLICSDRSICETVGTMLCNTFGGDHLKGTSRNKAGDTCQAVCVGGSVGLVRLKATCP